MTGAAQEKAGKDNAAAAAATSGTRPPVSTVPLQLLSSGMRLEGAHGCWRAPNHFPPAITNGTSSRRVMALSQMFRVASVTSDEPGCDRCRSGVALFVRISHQAPVCLQTGSSKTQLDGGGTRFSPRVCIQCCTSAFPGAFGWIFRERSWLCRRMEGQ